MPVKIENENLKIELLIRRQPAGHEGIEEDENEKVLMISN
jgi:hypothetical protein